MREIGTLICWATIRVKSKQELMECIYLYFEEVNQEPVVYHWTYKMDEVRPGEAMAVGIKSNADCNS